MSERLEAVAFVGDSLAPFFLEDPQLGAERVQAGLDAFSSLDVESAALEWPFGDRALVVTGLADMVDGSREGVTDELTWEFRRLFVGPGHKAAAPWGSVYLDHDAVMFGESALALSAWMRRNGIARLADDGDPEDHIGLLLLMMAWIARHRAELLEEFLGEHVLTWSSHYLEKLEREAAHPFYRGLAVLARASLEGVQSELTIEVKYPARYFR